VAVLALLLCSLLVPLAFLFDLSSSGTQSVILVSPLSLPPPQCGSDGVRSVLGSLPLPVDLAVVRLL
jgi:hypothetical protein